MDSEVADIGTAQAHMKLREPEGRAKAWHVMQLLEAVSDYDSMSTNL